jgi:hypothetical protein
MSGMIIILLMSPLIQEKPIGKQTKRPTESLQPPSAIPTSQKQDKSASPAPASRPVKKRPSSQDERSFAVDEISKIRDRIGIKLFPTPGGDQNFQQQIDRLLRNPTHQRTPNQNPTLANQPPRPAIAPNPTLQPPGTTGLIPLMQPGHGNLSKAGHLSQTMQSIANSIENLDKAALELEKQGNFDQSEVLRKLSRKIRKHWKRLTGYNLRDN